MTKPWRVLGSTELLDCSPWLRVIVEHVRLPNGHELPDFYRIEMPEWSQIFAVTEDGRVAMIEQYKHGPASYHWNCPPDTWNRANRRKTARGANCWRKPGWSR